MFSWIDLYINSQSILIKYTTPNKFISVIFCIVWLIIMTLHRDAQVLEHPIFIFQGPAKQTVSI